MIGGEFNKNLVSVNGTVCTGRKVIVWGRNRLRGPTDQSDSSGVYLSGRKYLSGKGREAGLLWRYTCSLTRSQCTA